MENSTLLREYAHIGMCLAGGKEERIIFALRNCASKSTVSRAQCVHLYSNV